MNKRTATKGERTHIRLPKEQKERLSQYCSNTEHTMSDFIRDAIEEKLYRESPAYQIEKSMLGNRISNILNEHPRLDKNLKAQILKEVENYA